MVTFLRQDTRRHSRLGKKRPKLQRWRKPRGLHNKVRLKRKSYPIQPGVGFKSNKEEKGKISGLVPIVVYNTGDLMKVGKSNLIIVGKVGAKKRLEILKKADEMKLTVQKIRITKNKLGEKNATK